MVANAPESNRAGPAPRVSELIPVTEAAEIVGVNPRTILKRIEDGRLVAQRMGARTYMVLRSSAEEYAATVSNRSNRKRAEAAAQKRPRRPSK